MLNCFDITKFGAVADGKTDCTKAIQSALDEAGKVEGEVIVPPGEYLCGYVRVPRGVTVKGTYAWEFAKNGGSILKLNRSDVPCLMDITGGFGCCLDGICIDGGDLGEDIHGVMLKWEDRLESRKAFGGKEDTPTIANCRISNFSGNAVHYEKVWCFSIRNSMLGFSKNGLYVHGCDAFITDTWFSCNKQDGVHAQRLMAATFTGCRIECNYSNGVYMYDCGVVQFGNCYYDANAKNGFYCADEGEDFRGNLTFNGNIFYRSGYDLDNTGVNDETHSHICISHATNIIISGNNFVAGDSGALCPAYGVTIKQLRNSVIANNSFMYASSKQNLVDLGGHKDDMIITNNTGLNALTSKEHPWPRFED
ncbi:MAG: right-handed parallel beta-helix repeat-containing protein [Clostridia bacterium]|nr:right-handed parallel beta-helix repeat-containing protein [Clostridia bacterium]